MKTYSEALGIFHFKADDVAAAEIAVRRATGAFDIAAEIIEDPRTHALIRSMMESHGTRPGCDCATCTFAFEVAMSAYLNGVRIGMEMEKQELPT